MLKPHEQLALSRKLCKLEASATSTLSDKHILLSLGDNEDHFANAHSMTMRLVDITKHFKKFDILPCQ